MENVKSNAVSKIFSDVKKELGTYYFVDGVNSLQDPYDKKNKNNFLRFIDLNFDPRSDIDEISLAYNFLAKKLNHLFINIEEKLNSEYYNWHYDNENKYFAKNIDQALLAIENKIDNFIKNLLRKYDYIEKVMKKKGITDKFLMMSDFNQKLAFIFENKDAYKGKISDFVNINVERCFNDNSKEIKVPVITTDHNKNFSVFAIRENSIIKIDGAYIYSADIDKENNSLNLRVEVPKIREDIYSFPFLCYDLESDMFVFHMCKDLFLSHEDAKNKMKSILEEKQKEVSNMIEKINAA